jgi:hypothetical protein
MAVILTTAPHHTLSSHLSLPRQFPSQDQTLQKIVVPGLITIHEFERRSPETCPTDLIYVLELLSGSRRRRERSIAWGARLLE